MGMSYNYCTLTLICGRPGQPAAGPINFGHKGRLERKWLILSHFIPASLPSLN